MFTGGREGALWYYRTLVTTYRSIEGFDSRLVDELDRIVTDIEGELEAGYAVLADDPDRHRILGAIPERAPHRVADEP